MAKPILIQDSTGKRKRGSLIVLDTGFTLDETSTGDPLIGGGGGGGGGDPTESLALRATAAADFFVVGDVVDIPIDQDYTIVEAEILADQVGSASVSVYRATNAGYPTFVSIAGATPPTLSGQRRVLDTTLGDWTTALAAGDIVRLSLDSLTTATQVTVALLLQRTADVRVSLYRKLTIVRTLTLAGQVEDIPVDQDGTITQAQLILDTSGSATVEVSRAATGAFPTFTRIDGGTPVTASGVPRVVDTTLTGWTPTVSSGDTVRFRLATFGSGLTRATFALTLEVGTVLGGGGFGGTPDIGSIPRVTGAQTLGTSGLADDGSTITASRPVVLQGGLTRPIRTVSSTTTLDADDYLVVVTSSATLNLPAAASHTGRAYEIVPTSGATAILDPNSSELIDGATSLALTSGALIACDGTSWYSVAKAAGGGGGGMWWFDPPSAASFSLASGDATNLTLTDDTDAGLLIDGGTPVTGDKSRFAYRTITTKTLDWVLVVRSEMFVPEGNFSGVGIACRDSVSGRMMSITLRGSANWLQVNRWNGLTGFNAAASTVNITQGVPIQWMRISKTGTTLNFDVSAGGKTWLNRFSETSTTFLTNNADQVGLVVDYNRSSGMHNTHCVTYFSLTGTAV